MPVIGLPRRGYAEEGCRLLSEVGDRGWLCTAHAKLGSAYQRLGRLDEAEAQVALSRELGAPDDIANEQEWREVQARVFARRAEAEAAKKLARELVALGEPGDLMHRSSGLLALAEALELNGDVKQAAGTLELVIDGFERKGLVPMAERARNQLANLRRQSSERSGADTRI